MIHVMREAEYCNRLNSAVWNRIDLARQGNTQLDAWLNDHDSDVNKIIVLLARRLANAMAKPFPEDPSEAALTNDAAPAEAGAYGIQDILSKTVIKVHHKIVPMLAVLVGDHFDLILAMAGFDMPGIDSLWSEQPLHTCVGYLAALCVLFLYDPGTGGLRMGGGSHCLYKKAIKNTLGSRGFSIEDAREWYGSHVVCACDYPGWFSGSCEQKNSDVPDMCFMGIKSNVVEILEGYAKELVELDLLKRESSANGGYIYRIAGGRIQF